MESKSSGQLGITLAGMSVDTSASLMVDEGGQAGMDRSVGGSGGQTSSSAFESAFESSGGVLGMADGGGQADVRGAAGGASEARATSSTTSPAGAGMVCAHAGAGVCIVIGRLGSVSFAGSAGGSVCAQSGLDFCIGSAGSGSLSGSSTWSGWSSWSGGAVSSSVAVGCPCAVSVSRPGARSERSGGSSSSAASSGVEGGCEDVTTGSTTGMVRAQIGVVSLVGTAGTGGAVLLSDPGDSGAACSCESKLKSV